MAKLGEIYAMRQARRYRSVADGSRITADEQAVLHPHSEPVWLTVAQLCSRWQLGRKTVYKFIDAKILPAWRVGKRLYRVAVADVLRFEAQNRVLRK